jgi:hypothetical protein
MKKKNTTVLIDKFSDKLDGDTFFLSQKFSNFIYTIFLNYNLNISRIKVDLSLNYIRFKVFSKNDENKSFYFDFIETLQKQNRYLLKQKQHNHISYFKENILLLENEEDCFNFFIKEINNLNLNSKKILLLEKTVFNYEK